MPELEMLMNLAVFRDWVFKLDFELDVEKIKMYRNFTSVQLNV